jgi:hypothetical protein
MPVNQAIKLFNLDRKKVNREPIMRGIPGSYCLSYIHTQSRRVRLICVENVKRMTLALHGSQTALEQFTNDSPHLQRDKHLAFWIAKAPLEPLGLDPMTLPTRANKPSDKFCGMASIPFPFVHG